MSNELSIYRERAYLVAHLAVIYPSVLVPGADPEEPDWPVIFIKLPTGQASWHIAPEDTDLFAHVSGGNGTTWDGHTTAEKYDRIERLTDGLAIASAQPSSTGGRNQPSTSIQSSPAPTRSTT